MMGMLRSAVKGGGRSAVTTAFGSGSAGGWGSMVGGATLGAVSGGTTSYGSGGGFWRGAAAGGVVGSVAGGVHASRMLSAKATSFKFQRGASSFTNGLVNMTLGFDNPAHRRAVFGAGGALGGFLFGGNRSHKRGFNRGRGNSIGR